MQSISLVVTGTGGLHARAAAALVSLCREFRSRITVEKEGVCADTGSIMDLLLLGAGQGSRLLVRAEGDDAEDALKAVSELFVLKFEESGRPSC